MKFVSGKTIPRRVPLKGVHLQSNKRCSLILINRVVSTDDQEIQADLENPVADREVKDLSGDWGANPEFTAAARRPRCPSGNRVSDLLRRTRLVTGSYP